MSVTTGVSLSRALMLDEMLKHAKTNPQSHFDGATKIAIGLTRKTALALIKNNLAEIDPNPGDYGCQMRTDILLRFGSSDTLKKEGQELLEQMKTISPKAHKATSLEELNQIQLSEEMAFLISSTLLTVTKARGKTNPFGFQCTKTEPGKLTTFSKKLLPFPLLDQLTNLNASKVATVSIEFLRKAAQTNKGPDQKLHEQALSERHIRYIGKEGSQRPFALIPIQVKVLLETMSHLGSIVAIQHLKDRSSRIFFRACPEGFKPIEFHEVEQHSLLGVFQIGLKPNFSMREVKSAIEKHGLKEAILHLASLQAPYDQATSTLEDVKDEESKKLIEDYRSMNLDLPFEIFHVYCDNHSGVKI